jgi:hypothetical protein
VPPPPPGSAPVVNMNLVSNSYLCFGQCMGLLFYSFIYCGVLIFDQINLLTEK